MKQRRQPDGSEENIASIFIAKDYRLVLRPIV
jgi:hypothetical protein